MNEFYPQVSGIWLRIGKLTKRDWVSNPGTFKHPGIGRWPAVPSICVLGGRASSLHLPVAFTSTQVGIASRNLERWKQSRRQGEECRLLVTGTVQPCWGASCITRPLSPLSPQAEAAGQDGGVLQTHLRRRPPHGAAGQVPGKRSEPVPQGRTPPYDRLRGAPLARSVCLSLGVCHAVDREPSGGWRGAPEGVNPCLTAPLPSPCSAPCPSRASGGCKIPTRASAHRGSPRAQALSTSGILTSERRGPGKQDVEGGGGHSSLPLLATLLFPACAQHNPGRPVVWPYPCFGKESSRKMVLLPLPSSAPAPVSTRLSCFHTSYQTGCKWRIEDLLTEAHRLSKNNLSWDLHTCCLIYNILLMGNLFFPLDVQAEYTRTKACKQLESQGGG